MFLNILKLLCMNKFQKSIYIVYILYYTLLQSTISFVVLILFDKADNIRTLPKKSPSLMEKIIITVLAFENISLVLAI